MPFLFTTRITHGRYEASAVFVEQKQLLLPVLKESGPFPTVERILPTYRAKRRNTILLEVYYILPTDHGV